MNTRDPPNPVADSCKPRRVVAGGPPHRSRGVEVGAGSFATLRRLAVVLRADTCKDGRSCRSCCPTMDLMQIPRL